MLDNGKNSIGLEELDHLLEESFLEMDFNNPKNETIMQVISNNVMLTDKYADVSTTIKPKVKLNSIFIWIICGLSAVMATVFFLYHPSENTSRENSATINKSEQAVPEVSKTVPLEFGSLPIVNEPTVNEKGTQNLPPTGPEKIAAILSVADSPNVHKEFPKDQRYSEPAVATPVRKDSTFVFPKLTEQEIKDNNKQKKKMIAALAKFSNDKYAEIKMGTFNYKGDAVSLYPFYISNAEVTNLEYRTFIYDLLIQDRKDEFLKARPDQQQWMKEFNRPFMQPMVDNYFSHVAYNDYPIVNITREGAEMYCKWLTVETNKYLQEKGKPLINDVRIPADVEWTYAAMGGFQDAVYPWHSKMIDKTYTNANQKVRNHRGCFLANFCLRKFSEKADTTSECYKVKGKYKGAYTTAGFMLGYEVFTVPVYSYNPNDYGLYCMSGNAAEMVNVTAEKGNKIVGVGTRGGSWNSSDKNVKITGEDEHAGNTNALPYVGFRPVISKSPKRVKMD
jgi:formylglycine-generating enzyme required for sulfatase activity